MIEVMLRDAYHNLVNTTALQQSAAEYISPQVTVVLEGAGEAEAQLGGTLMQSFHNGSATFRDLSLVSRPGRYRLRIRSDGQQHDTHVTVRRRFGPKGRGGRGYVEG